MTKTALVLALLGLLLVSGAPATAWTTDINFSSEGRADILTLGFEEGASDEFDTGVDVPLPPPPPSSPFSAYLVGNGLFEMLQTDIRATQSWNIYVTSKGTIDVAWTAASVPLTMTIGEDLFPLTESGHHSLGAGEYWIAVQAAQSPSSPEPANAEDGSPSSVSSVSEMPTSTSPTILPSASPTTPGQTRENVSLPPITAEPDTTIWNAPDTISGTPQISQPGEAANRTPGFGAVLALLGISALIFARRNRNAK